MLWLCPVQVAQQLASVVRSVTEACHTMWDFHEDDVLIDQLASPDPHLTVLDVFMKPSEFLGTNLD